MKKKTFQSNSFKHLKKNRCQNWPNFSFIETFLNRLMWFKTAFYWIIFKYTLHGLYDTNVQIFISFFFYSINVHRNQHLAATITAILSSFPFCLHNYIHKSAILLLSIVKLFISMCFIFASIHFEQYVFQVHSQVSWVFNINQILLTF